MPRLATSTFRSITCFTCLLLGASLPAFAIDPDKQFDDYVKDTWSIEEGLPQITVLAIAQDPEDYIWVGTQAGLARFDGVHFEPFDPDNTPELPGLMIQDLFLDTGDHLWVSTYKGVAFYRDGSFTRVPYRDLDGEEVPIDARMVREETSGTVLVASIQGLMRFQEGKLVRDPRLREGASYGLLAEKGVTWVGGVGKVTGLTSDGDRDIRPLPAGREATLVQHLVSAHGYLWAGTSTGLFRWIDNRWEHFDEGANALAELPVTALYEDLDSNLWVATSDGLARLREGRQVEFISNDDESAHPQVRAIYEDHERNLWLGSHWFGVARLWNGWTRRYASKEGLQDELVWSVTRGRQGELWVGTSEGLEVMRNGHFEKLLDGGDLPHPHAYTLLDDGKRLWIGTRTGLVWYRDGEVEMPEFAMPLATTQVSGIVLDSRQNYWIGSNDGLYRYAEGSDAAGPTMTRIGVGDDERANRIRVIEEMR
ncbi:MAG: two-component regulator propeller domain-containing protein, partial [Gammaproteobacteria bacterium]|nr:two-component regulator propeller domain-containing protein [Gammaproteobacteria bacterium]